MRFLGSLLGPLELMACVFVFVPIAGVLAVLWYLSAKRNAGIQPPGFAVVDGPGKFLIVGVNRQTKLDTTWECVADSSANARVRAELEGIIVTDVKRV